MCAMTLHRFFLLAALLGTVREVRRVLEGQTEYSGISFPWLPNWGVDTLLVPFWVPLFYGAAACMILVPFLAYLRRPRPRQARELFLSAG